jgi:hypothetical protein
MSSPVFRLPAPPVSSRVRGMLPGKNPHSNRQSNMLSVTQDAVPEDALLRTYRGGAHPGRWRESGDCFAVSVDRVVSLAEFVFAFYTSPLFRIERAILALLAGAPSADSEARELADGSGTSFAVWRVGERTTTQLLMCDRYERTRSWFRVVPLSDGMTLLQFGSAVAARGGQPSEIKARGSFFRLLLKFHVVYSQVLLNAAKRGVMRSRVHV